MEKNDPRLNPTATSHPTCTHTLGGRGNDEGVRIGIDRNKELTKKRQGNEGELTTNLGEEGRSMEKDEELIFQRFGEKES